MYKNKFQIYFSILFILIYLCCFSVTTVKTEDKQCQIIGDYCILRENCSATLIYPFICANDNTLNSCEVILHWNLTDPTNIFFYLSKSNVFLNKWLTLGFSNSQSFSTFDAIVGVSYSNSTSEIYNGYANENGEVELNNINNSSLSHINQTAFGTVMKFGKNFNENTINFNNCTNDTNGIYFLVSHGDFNDNDTKIAYSSSNTNKIIFGPYCMISCLLNNGIAIITSSSTNKNIDIDTTIAATTTNTSIDTTSTTATIILLTEAATSATTNGTVTIEATINNHTTITENESSASETIIILNDTASSAISNVVVTTEAASSANTNVEITTETTVNNHTTITESESSASDSTIILNDTANIASTAIVVTTETTIDDLTESTTGVSTEPETTVFTSNSTENNSSTASITSTTALTTNNYTTDYITNVASVNSSLVIESITTMNTTNAPKSSTIVVTQSISSCLREMYTTNMYASCYNNNNDSCSKWLLSYNYNKNKDQIEFLLKSPVSVKNANLALLLKYNQNEAYGYMIYANINQDGNLILYENIINNNGTIVQLPRNTSSLTNIIYDKAKYTISFSKLRLNKNNKFDISLRDCLYMSLFASNENITSDEFLNQIQLQNTRKQTANTTTCFDTCGYSTLENIRIYVRLRITNYDWSDTLYDLSSDSSVVVFGKIYYLFIVAANDANYLVKNLTLVNFRPGSVIATVSGYILTTDGQMKVAETIKNSLNGQNQRLGLTFDSPETFRDAPDTPVATTTKATPSSTIIAIAVSCSVFGLFLLIGICLFAYYLFVKRAYKYKPKIKEKPKMNKKENKPKPNKYVRTESAVQTTPRDLNIYTNYDNIYAPNSDEQKQQQYGFQMRPLDKTGSIKVQKKTKHEYGIDTVTTKSHTTTTTTDSQRNEESDQNLILDGNLVPTSTVSHGPSDRNKLPQITTFNDSSLKRVDRKPHRFHQDQILRGNIDFNNSNINTHTDNNLSSTSNYTDLTPDFFAVNRKTGYIAEVGDEMVVSPIIVSQDEEQFYKNSPEEVGIDVDERQMNSDDRKRDEQEQGDGLSSSRYGYVSSRNYQDPNRSMSRPTSRFDGQNISIEIPHTEEPPLNTSARRHAEFLSTFKMNHQDKSMSIRSNKSTHSSDYLTLYPTRPGSVNKMATLVTVVTDQFIPTTHKDEQTDYENDVKNDEANASVNETSLHTYVDVAAVTAAAAEAEEEERAQAHAQLSKLQLNNRNSIEYNGNSDSRENPNKPIQNGFDFKELEFELNNNVDNFDPQNDLNLKDLPSNFTSLMSTDSHYREQAYSKQPEFILPANILNIAYSNQAKKQQDKQDQHNESNLKSSLKPPKTDKNGQHDEPMQISTTYNTELSVESRKKIDEIKTKLDALNKKYAAEADNALEKTFTGPKKQISFKEINGNSQRSSQSYDNERHGASSRLSNGHKYDPLDDFPKPRLCEIRVDPNFNGLGLHIGDVKSTSVAVHDMSIAKRVGNNMIRKVEVGSPAETGGLKPGDRILEINGENTENLEYNMLINKLRDALKTNDTIELVVMNAVEYNIYKSNSFSITRNDISGGNLNESSMSPQQNHVNASIDSKKYNGTSSIPSSVFSSLDKSSQTSTNQPSSPSLQLPTPPPPALFMPPPHAPVSTTVKKLYDYQPIKTQIPENELPVKLRPDINANIKSQPHCEPPSPILVTPQIVRMDNYAINVWNSSSEEYFSEDSISYK